MRGKRAAAVSANGPLMQCPTQPSGPGFTLSWPSRNPIIPAVGGGTPGGGRGRKAARVAAPNRGVGGAEVAVLRDALAHVAQLVAKARRIHVQDDRGVLTRCLGTRRERVLAPVFGVDDDVLFNHLRPPTRPW